MRKRRQRGEINYGCVFSFIVLALAVYVGLKVIPVKVHAAEFSDFIKEQAEIGSIKKDGVIRYEILQKAKELDLPVDDAALIIERTQGKIHISVEYMVELDFNGLYKYEWEFDHTVDRILF